MRGAKISKTNKTELHITGAEGLFEDRELLDCINSYAKRAITHSKGMPDKVIINFEKINEKPKKIASLPISTFKSKNQLSAEKKMNDLLRIIGISDIAIEAGMSVLKKGISMRGAAIVGMKTGIRLEPDKERGVRVSRLGITSKASNVLSKELSLFGIDNNTVKEAVVLASKVASCPLVYAEACISDDPDYTTGYVASRRLGYVRLTNIKKLGSRAGGRVFFVKDNVNIAKLLSYLETRPVMVAGVRR